MVEEETPFSHFNSNATSVTVLSATVPLQTLASVHRLQESNVLVSITIMEYFILNTSIFKAICTTVGITNCSLCSSRERCQVVSAENTPICNCHSDCYRHGDCCSDISQVDNCVGE